MRSILVASLVTLAGCLLAGCSGNKKLLAEQQGQITALQQRADGLVAQLKERDAQITALDGQKAEAEGRTKELTDKLAAAQAQIDSLQGSNKELANSLEADKGDLGRQLKAAVEEKDRAAKQLNDAGKERARLSARLARLGRQNEQLSRQVTDLEQQAAERKRQAELDEKKRSDRLASVHEDLGKLADAVLKEIEAEQVAVEQKGDTIELTLREPLLFEPQQAKLTDAGIALLDRVGAALRSLPPRPVRVEGHSDNSRIKWELFGRFTSHWDLSAARATAVARYLHEHAGLDPRQLTASGFGEFRPAKGNDTPEGRAANRRVVLVVEAPKEKK